MQASYASQVIALIVYIDSIFFRMWLRMMRCVSVVSAFCLILAVGCAVATDQEIEASLDETFELAVGDSALISPENIAVTFLAVTADSRCGKGDTCVWAGDGVVQIRVQVNGIDQGKYEVHSNPREGSAASFDSFNIRLVSLLPQAVAGTVIAQDEYVAVLRIARGFAGNDGVH